MGQVGYSKQAYYKSLSRQKAKKDPREQVRDKVLSVRHLLPQLGTRKLYRLLGDDFQRQGIKIGRDKLFSLLREESLLVVRKRKYVRTTDSRLWMRQYPDLTKGLELLRPEQLWVSDITYLSTRQGYGYLHLITDALIHHSDRGLQYCSKEYTTVLKDNNNTYRPHLSNGLLTPEQMHHQKKLKPRSWKTKTAGFSKETSG